MFLLSTYNYRKLYRIKLIRWTSNTKITMLLSLLFSNYHQPTRKTDIRLPLLSFVFVAYKRGLFGLSPQQTFVIRYLFELFQMKKIKIEVKFLQPLHFFFLLPLLILLNFDLVTKFLLAINILHGTIGQQKRRIHLTIIYFNHRCIIGIQFE